MPDDKPTELSRIKLKTEYILVCVYAKNLPLGSVNDTLHQTRFASHTFLSVLWARHCTYIFLHKIREYTRDKLLEALELILFNTNIQFNGSIFKQMLRIPMGGNASPFIADLYLSWCEYCYMHKVVPGSLEQNFQHIECSLTDRPMLWQNC